MDTSIGITTDQYMHDEIYNQNNQCIADFQNITMLLK